MSEWTKEQLIEKLKKLGPYKKEPTEIHAGIQWYKVIDRNGVPLVNYDIAEDKADFICQGVNNFDTLLGASRIGLSYINAVITKCPRPLQDLELDKASIEVAIAAAEEKKEVARK